MTALREVADGVRVGVLGPGPIMHVVVLDDGVDGFEVLEVPGHSPGNLALWREGDGVLIVGDGPVNVGGRTAPRWLGLPRSLNDDHDEARRSRARLAALDPQLVVSIHGRPAVADEAWRRTLLGR